MPQSQNDLRNVSDYPPRAESFVAPAAHRAF